jgi:prophage maintenance system killer protein
MISTELTQIYQAENGELEITIDDKQDTIWLTQEQIALLFDKSYTTINGHILNIFKEKEVDELVCIRKYGNSVNSITKPKNYYNLDLILSVGYRTNSKQATRFRQWVNTILKDYLLKGYTLNKKLLEKQQSQILEIKETLDFLVNSAALLDNHNNFISILHQYTGSLITLNQYDEDRLESFSGSESVLIEIQELREFITKTKTSLIEKGEATDLFGKEYTGKFDGTISAIYQSFGGVDIYASAQEKAANLLYLVVKNHGFVDGNKRIGSILFVYFLNKNNILRRKNGELKITENTLVALALLVAQSNPESKNILIKLIIKLLQD